VHYVDGFQSLIVAWLSWKRALLRYSKIPRETKNFLWNWVYFVAIGFLWKHSRKVTFNEDPHPPYSSRFKELQQQLAPLLRVNLSVFHHYDWVSPCEGPSSFFNFCRLGFSWHPSCLHIVTTLNPDAMVCPLKIYMKFFFKEYFSTIIEKGGSIKVEILHLVLEVLR
jgi:hypothetical protein